MKEVLLTQADIDLLNTIQLMETAVAADFMAANGWSIQHSSTKLKELYEQGYLMRRDMKSRSGGSEYVYWFHIRDED